MESIKGQLFIEPKEATGIPLGTMCSNISRGKYTAIDNPHYNGRNAKKLILVDSLPEKEKQAILSRFQGNIKTLEQGLESGLKTNPNLEVTEIITEATANIVQIGERFVSAEYISYIDKHYKDHIDYFVNYQIKFQHTARYARTCALIQKIWDDCSALGNISQDIKAFKRIRRAFVLNLTQLLSNNKELNVIVPKSDYRMTEWMDQVLNALNTPTSVYELVGVKNSGNDNNLRFTDEQKKIAQSIFNRGNVPSITSIYDKLVEMGKERNWWIKDGEYKPISIGTLCNFFQPKKNISEYGRKGNMDFINNTVPSIQRKMPEFINEVWSMDGSPIDILVFYKGKARQVLNSYRVFDVGSQKWIGTSTWLESGEPEEKVMEALLNAFSNTGVLPRAIQMDRGGGFAAVKRFCEAHGVIFFPANTGLARAKIAESLIGRFGKILKKRNDWAGQNREALGENSQISPEQYKEAQKSAQSYEQVSHWLRTIGMDEWNNTIIKKLERKTCDKSPNQLYTEKPCRGKELDEITKLSLIGRAHTVKLSIDGLTVQNNLTQYTYFPDVCSEDGRDRGMTLYLNTPLNNHPVTGKLTLYFEDYGSEWAYVFNKPIDKGGKFQDKWRMKTSPAYLASLNNDTALLKYYRDFQEDIKTLAKEQKADDDKTYKAEVLTTAEDKEVQVTNRQKTQKLFIENKKAKKVLQKDMDAGFQAEEEAEEIVIIDRLTGKPKKIK